MASQRLRCTPALFAAVLTAATGAASAATEGDWLIRGRVINVSPNTQSKDISTIPGAQVGVADDFTAEVDFTYMVTGNLGLELIVATTRHALQGGGVLAGTAVGTTGVLPPTLTLQYHFTPERNVRPYAGAGINYTLFYDKESSLAGTRVDLDNSLGLSAQAGVDLSVGNGWFVNADLKYIDINTTAKLAGGVNGTVDVQIDPWVFSLGAGTKF